MQVGRNELWTDRSDDLREFFALSQDRNRFDDRHAGLCERMTAVEPFFVLDHADRNYVLAHCSDYIVCELGSNADLIDKPVNL
jgi:hypothetical protein